MSFFKSIKNTFKKANKMGRSVLKAGLPIFGAVYGGPVGAAIAGGSQFINEPGEDPQHAADKESQRLQNENAAIQREFAQHGVRWRVEDAKAAGIHPLAALGMSPMSFNPISVGGYSGPTSPTASEIGWNMGQDISRAMAAKQTESERAAVALANARVHELQVRQLELQNQGLAIDNASALSAFVRSREALPPPMPGLRTKGGNGREVKVAARNVIGEPGKPGQEAGSIEDYGWTRTAYGGYTKVPGKDVTERIEDKLIPETMWALRNQIYPALGIGGFGGAKPPNHFKRRHERWVWNPILQEWQAKPRISGPAYMQRGYIPPGH